MLHVVYRVGDMQKHIDYYKNLFGMQLLRYRCAPPPPPRRPGCCANRAARAQQQQQQQPDVQALRRPPWPGSPGLRSELCVGRRSALIISRVPASPRLGASPVCPGAGAHPSRSSIMASVHVRRDIPDEKYSNAFLGFGPEDKNFARGCTTPLGARRAAALPPPAASPRAAATAACWRGPAISTCHAHNHAHHAH
jgi:hypothetical protein